jgi:broad specificity phosphatase PhoE
MAVILLIRHGETDQAGVRLSGRLPEVHLNSTGTRQAERLAAELALMEVEQIYSSPLERARETAAPSAQRLSLPVLVEDKFNEMDFGQWTGCSFAELAARPQWRQFNLLRSTTRIPGGELMAEVQIRMVAGLLEIAGRSPEAVIAVFSHCDPIRAALAFFTGMAIDFFQRLVISPGSISLVKLNEYETRVAVINHTGDLSVWLEENRSRQWD